MKATANDPVHELKAVLAEHLPWHGARIGFLAQFLLALFKVRSVNLAKRSTGFGGKAQVDSHYKRLQRFFRSFERDPAHWARRLVRLVPVGDGPWRLTLDRTHWKFGAVDINFLVLGVGCWVSPIAASPSRRSGASWTMRATPTRPSGKR